MASQVSLEMVAPTEMTLSARPGSPMVLAPGPLLPAEMTSWTPNASMMRVYSSARALLPSLSAGRPPMDMLMMSTPRLAARSIMPSVSATEVQPPLQVQAREETSLAPGAAPFILPPNSELAAVMPATWVPWEPSMMPMLTKSAFLPTQLPPYGSMGTPLRTSTTKGTCSTTSVFGSSLPK